VCEEPHCDDCGQAIKDPMCGKCKEQKLVKCDKGGHVKGMAVLIKQEYDAVIKGGYVSRCCCSEKTLKFLDRVIRCVVLVFWLVGVLSRILIMVLMVIITYMGCVAFLFLSVLSVATFIVSSFVLALCRWPDDSFSDMSIAAHFVTCFYWIPLFELLASIDIALIKSFFNDLWGSVEFGQVTELLWNEADWLRAVVRLCFSVPYFFFAGSLLVFCFNDKNSGRGRYAIGIGAICLFVPVVGFISPMFFAWFQFLMGLCCATPPSKDKNARPISRFFKIVYSDTFCFLDPADLLGKTDWYKFLASDFTEFARPSCCLKRSNKSGDRDGGNKKRSPECRQRCASFLLVSILLVCAVLMDSARVRKIGNNSEPGLDKLTSEMKYVHERYGLDFSGGPGTDGETDRDRLIARIFFDFAIFAFAVLSNLPGIVWSSIRKGSESGGNAENSESTTTNPSDWPSLKKNYASVLRDKVVGCVIGVVSLVAMIAGAAAREAYPESYENLKHTGQGFGGVLVGAGAFCFLAALTVWIVSCVDCTGSGARASIPDIREIPSYTESDTESTPDDGTAAQRVRELIQKVPVDGAASSVLGASAIIVAIGALIIQGTMHSEHLPTVVIAIAVLVLVLLVGIILGVILGVVLEDAGGRPVIGIVVFIVVISFLCLLGLIVVALVRFFRPWYSLHKVLSGDVPLPACPSEAKRVTNHDPRALCSRGVGGYSLLQLAAFPILAEAWNDSWLVDRLACLTDISLIRHTFVGYNSTAVVAFDTSDGKFAVAMPAMSDFRHDFGLFCENLLTSYDENIMHALGVPFYPLAYGFVLGDLLPFLGRQVIAVLLGPRLSEFHLHVAETISGTELEIASAMLKAHGLSPERPVIIGHGANGLLAKAVKISSDPWRVSFEGPKVGGTEMAANANLTKYEAKRGRIVNYHSEPSFYALVDECAFVNDEIPYYGLPKWLPPNPFETFCFTVAACWSDDRFDDLCKDVFHNSTKPLIFSDIWRTLGRERFA
jgi:hypothetical protein